MLPLPIPTSLFFGSEDPLAPIGHGSWHHRDLTRAACLGEGWNSAAADETAWATVGVDLYSYHPLWRLRGGRTRWRAARRIKPLLDALHFDDLTSTAEIEEIWHRILGGIVIGLQKAFTEDDVAAARHLVGVSLHAVQDFYSHSTWVDSPDRHTSTWLSTWNRTSSGLPLPPDLVTGGFALSDRDTPPHGQTRPTPAALLRLPALLAEPLTRRLPRPAHRSRLPRGVRSGGPAGINLDSRWQAPASAALRRSDLSPDALFELAYHLALTESRRWLGILASQVGDAAWSRIASAPPQDWTKAFERSTGALYDFLTAGEYPPQASPDSHLWFLRVTPLDPRRPVLIELTSGDRVVAQRSYPGQPVVVGPVDGWAQVRVGEVSAQVLAFRRAPVATWHILAEHLRPETPLTL